MCCGEGGDFCSSSRVTVQPEGAWTLHLGQRQSSPAEHPGQCLQPKLGPHPCLLELTQRSTLLREGLSLLLRGHSLLRKGTPSSPPLPLALLPPTLPPQCSCPSSDCVPPGKALLPGGQVRGPNSPCRWDQTPDLRVTPDVRCLSIAHPAHLPWTPPPAHCSPRKGFCVHPASWSGITMEKAEEAENQRTGQGGGQWPLGDQEGTVLWKMCQLPRRSWACWPFEEWHLGQEAASRWSKASRLLGRWPSPGGLLPTPYQALAPPQCP